MLLYERQWPPDDLGFHADLIAAILAREASEAGLTVSNVGGWHSRPDLIEWAEPGVQALVDRIASEAHAAGATRVQAWANVMRAGAYQLAHRHGDAEWSGVYYVDAGTTSCGGRITFACGEDARTIVPCAGLLLMFPGDLLHSVEVYRGDRPRISVAFNLAR